MQPGRSLSFLLTALLFALAQVEAAPVKQPPRMITMPLKRVPQQPGIPPSVRLQQHINRSERRHARMNGLPGPSDYELMKRLEKRLYQAKYDKRYNRGGVKPNPVSSDVDVSAKSADLLADPDTVIDLNGSQNSTSPKNSTTPNAGFPQAGLDALLANGVTPANPPTTPNSLGLDVEGNDIGYFATLQAGTPPRNFSVIMDSGSADFWIGAEGCQEISSDQNGTPTPTGNDCGNHVFLGPKSSSTFNDSGNFFQVKYGQGEVAGTIIADNVNIAGLALDQHVFGVALAETVDFTNQSLSDGLMGLAQSSLSNQGVLTPVEALAKNGLITEAITSYKLSRVSDGLNDGEITFGGLDESKFDSKTLVTLENVSKLGFWEAALTASVNGQNLAINNITGILDTGTTLLLLPQADAAAVHAMIPGSRSDGQGGFIIPCTNGAVVSLNFGGQAFDINPVDILFAPVDPNDLQGDCNSGIVAGQIGGPNQWLVGDVFLKNVYYSTNVNKNAINLAKLV